MNSNVAVAILLIRHIVTLFPDSEHRFAILCSSRAENKYKEINKWQYGIYFRCH